MIVNAYAPTRNKVDEQLLFLDKLKKQLQGLDYVHLIMGGDWNTVFNPTLDKHGGSILSCTNQYTTDLINLMETYELVDITLIFRIEKELSFLIKVFMILFLELYDMLKNKFFFGCIFSIGNTR